MKRKYYLLIRFLVVLVTHVIFKLFDQSFTSIFEISWRSLFYSFLFISYWMIVWEFARRLYMKGMGHWIGLKGKYRQLFLVSSLEMLYAVCVSLLFNYLYQIADWFIFNKVWADIALLNPELMGDFHFLQELRINPELFYGLFFFFVLIYGVVIFVDLFRHMKEMEVTTAILKHENSQAKYQALKNQIDPHFFFNSLSVLSSLIYENQDESVRYVSHLSKLYRSILEIGSGQFIALQKELEVLDSYLFLLRIRFNEALQIENLLSDETLSRTVIIPHTLQMLIENAVKHNALTLEQPLRIRLDEDESYLIVSNNIQIKRLLEPQTRIGLKNIKNRYQMAINLEVEVMSTNKEFIVKLPKISHEHSTT